MTQSSRCLDQWPGRDESRDYRPMLSISRESWQTAQGRQQTDARQSLQMEPWMPPMVLTLVLMGRMAPATQNGIQQHSLSRVARRHIMHGKQHHVHSMEPQSSKQPHSPVEKSRCPSRDTSNCWLCPGCVTTAIFLCSQDLDRQVRNVCSAQSKNGRKKYLKTLHRRCVHCE
ncbi:hypothetical protein V1264_016383 [Littorina saxatilis]|uniref:Uncharacterized protein n=1 Tax=Littorina saxatilis TaxID=31220 RepID=A0AAN9BME0_9CAEN